MSSMSPLPVPRADFCLRSIHGGASRSKLFRKPTHPLLLSWTPSLGFPLLVFTTGSLVTVETEAVVLETCQRDT